MPAPRLRYSLSLAVVLAVALDYRTSGPHGDGDPTILLLALALWFGCSGLAVWRLATTESPSVWGW